MCAATSVELNASELRIAIVASRFNEYITLRLVEGARDALLGRKIPRENITEIWVPGAWELPMAAQALAATGRYHALVCLGCVIRGETSHHLYVAGEAARGIASVSLQTGVPIGFGVLTTETMEQAAARAAPGPDNKGADAALAALEMIAVLRRIGPPASSRPQ